MKKIQLLAATIICTLSSTANAYIDGKLSSYYFDVHGIVGFGEEARELEVNGTSIGTFETELAYGLGASIGYSFANNFRLETALEFESAKTDNTATGEEGSTRVIKGMINGYYDFQTGDYHVPLLGKNFIPYVGVGLGMLYDDFENADAYGIVYRGSAGVSYRVPKAEHYNIYVGYNYDYVPSFFKINTAPSVVSDLDYSFNYGSIKAGMRVAF